MWTFFAKAEDKKEDEPAARAADQQVAPRNAQVVGGVRVRRRNNRVRGNFQNNDDEEAEDANEGGDNDDNYDDMPINDRDEFGRKFAKKMAKLEAKAAKREQNEARFQQQKIFCRT